MGAVTQRAFPSLQPPVSAQPLPRDSSHPGWDSNLYQLWRLYSKDPTQPVAWIPLYKPSLNPPLSVAPPPTYLKQVEVCPFPTPLPQSATTRTATDPSAHCSNPGKEAARGLQAPLQEGLTFKGAWVEQITNSHFPSILSPHLESPPVGRVA